MPVPSDAERPIPNAAGASAPGLQVEAGGMEAGCPNGVRAAADLHPALAFLRFAPVPLRGRRDGWTPALQLRFVVALARGASVDEAARSLGRSRQTAYALRRREGAEEFADAWDSAVAFASEARGAAWTARRAAVGIETVLVPRFYRGRLVGYVQREHLGGTMARLALLDRLADRLEADPLGRATVRQSSGPLGMLPGGS